MGDNQKKYHITDEGDVYRVNEDGSFTSMGNAEKIQSDEKSKSPNISHSTSSSSKNTSEKKGRVLRIVILVSCILFLIVLFFACAVLLINTNSKQDEIAIESYIEEPSEERDTTVETTVEVSRRVSKRQEKGSDIMEGDSYRKRKPKEDDNKSIVYKGQSTDTKEQNIIYPAKPQESIDPNKVYYAVEVQAEFPGGDRARLQWLQDNVQWPTDAEGRQLEGDVELEFIIERDGTVTNVKVTKSDNAGLNSAAVRLISSMPKWTPAKVQGQPVRSPMGITLFF